MSSAVAAFKVINLALELLAASQVVLSRLYELQQRRIAEGREITEAEVDALLAEGDIQAAAEHARLVVAKLAQKDSLT